MPRRYKAPTENRAVLADPPAAALPALIEANRRTLDRNDIRIGGVPLRQLRAMARRQVLDAAREYLNESPPIATGGLSSDAPLLLAGHQPELSHPGVWAKNFALNGLAKRVGGIPLNLIVDNDTLKSTSLRFPVRDGRDPAGVRLESVAFDRFDGEEPYEDRRVHDRECFRTFAERAEPLWRTWDYEPLLPRAWEMVSHHRSDTPIGERFARVRRTWERTWGCKNLELPVSRLTRTRAFVGFVLHLVDDWKGFRDTYNAAVRRYRKTHGIRSRSHPVPDLIDAELPFWGPRGVDGRRERATAYTITQPTLVRPRALTLTLFARVCLGDFFIHGIGGGKYDEVTDAIIRDYFGIESPAFQVLSATLHLPLPAFPTAPADVTALSRRERDVFWNPQRHVPGPEAERPEVRELVRRHRELEAAEPADRAGRRERYRAFRAVGDRLRPRVEGRLAEARDWLARARQEAAANAALRRRDFAWVLYPEDALRGFMEDFLAAD